MSRYDAMTPAEILRTLGPQMRDLLAALPVPWDDPRPQTRDGLIARGLAYKGTRDGALVATFRGLDLLDLIHADVAADTWETSR